MPVFWTYALLRMRFTYALLRLNLSGAQLHKPQSLLLIYNRHRNEGWRSYERCPPGWVI